MLNADDQTPNMKRYKLEHSSQPLNRLLKWLLWGGFQIAILVGLFALACTVLHAQPSKLTQKQLSLLHQAREAQVKGQFEHAADLLKHCEKQKIPAETTNPLRSETLYAQARIHLQKNDMRNSLALAQKVLILTNDHPGALTLVRQLSDDLESTFRQAYVLETHAPTKAIQLYNKITRVLTGLTLPDHLTTLRHRVTKRLRQF